jgi:hypothetical protein
MVPAAEALPGDVSPHRYQLARASRRWGFGGTIAFTAGMSTRNAAGIVTML